MLPKIQNILYASDIGQGSRPAFRRAVSVMEQYNASLTFLHVNEEVPASAKSLMQTYISAEELQRFEEHGIENLNAEVKKRIVNFCESELEGIEAISPDQVTPIVRMGKPWRVILEVAKEINADLIIMGVRHHSRVESMLIGSTSSKVISHSSIPVMVVPLNGSDA